MQPTETIKPVQENRLLVALGVGAVIVAGLAWLTRGTGTVGARRGRGQ